MSTHATLRDLLFAAGLKESEVVTYIELLKKPATTTWELVARTGLAKSVVYRAFERLRALKMVEKTETGIRALSLKALVSELGRSQRNLAKVGYRIRQLAPFLRTPHEAIEEFETLYTQDQIIESYLGLASLDFDVSLDFGDFEAFVPVIKGLDSVKQFRSARLKHATNYAICTSMGPYTASFCTEEARVKFKNTVDIMPGVFKNNFVAFSDRNDYVLFNTFEDPENPVSVLVKSKTIADVQRRQLKVFSQMIGK